MYAMKCWYSTGMRQGAHKERESKQRADMHFSLVCLEGKGSWSAAAVRMYIDMTKQGWYLYIDLAVWVGVVYLDSADDRTVVARHPVWRTRGDGVPAR
jgi:hypothetical protein